MEMIIYNTSYFKKRDGSFHMLILKKISMWIPLGEPVMYFIIIIDLLLG